MKRKPAKPKADKPTPAGKLFPQQAPTGYAYVQAHYRRKSTKGRSAGKKRR